MGRDCILTRFALLAALRGAGGSKLIQLISLSPVSGMILAGASVALIFSPIRNDLPYIELSINFAFKISRAVPFLLLFAVSRLKVVSKNQEFFTKKKLPP